jgi:tRNA threonylcarbamoyladenosine biosynthesis protein TsaE
MPSRVDYVEGEPAMLAYGAALAGRLAAVRAALPGDPRGARYRESTLVTLEGDLGAGKTTLARGILRGLGFEGSVKSPTYPIVELYEFARSRVYHLDFYRIVDPRELDFIGLDELLHERAIVLVEWPERAQGRLPRADVEIRIRRQDAGRIVECDDRSS